MDITSSSSKAEMEQMCRRLRQEATHALEDRKYTASRKESSPHTQLRAYFLIDQIQLRYLSTLRSHYSHGTSCRQQITPADDQPYQLFSSVTRPLNIWNKEQPFGIYAPDNTILSVPRFCQQGRLKTFLQFKSGRGRIRSVHHFQFHAYPLQITEPFAQQPFCDENAWYYEMCSGVSLCSVIAATLYGCIQSHKNLAADLDGHTNSLCWTDEFIACVLSLLEQHREQIISCPAVYYRSAALQKILSYLDILLSARALEAACGMPISRSPLEQHWNLRPATFDCQQDWHLESRYHFSMLFQRFFTGPFLSLPHDPHPSDLDSWFAFYRLGALRYTVPDMNADVRIPAGFLSPRHSIPAARHTFLRYLLPGCEVTSKTLEKITSNLDSKTLNRNTSKIREAHLYERIFRLVHQALYSHLTQYADGYLSFPALDEI